MKRLTIMLICLLVLSLTSGCWDNKELDEYGYVQAVAIDQGEDDRFMITTHFYNPSTKIEMGQSGNPASKGINISTSGETFFEAIREIPAKFGRKAKWDHMRVILIGEQLARNLNIREVLDFFSRDQEPRGTVLPLIAEQAAAPFLDVSPFIEQTIGQQYKRMETSGALYAAKTSKIPLYELAIQMCSPSNTSVLPYLHKTSVDNKAIISGLALIQDGKMVELLKEKDTEAFMMLMDRYIYGALEFPCTNETENALRKKESLEVLTFNSKLTPTVNNGSVSVGVKIAIEGTIGELRCSHLKTSKDMKQFEQRIVAQVEQQVKHTTDFFKTKKVDALGIGNQIYQRNPQQWKQLEPVWKEKIAQTEFDINVEVKVLSTGMNSGTIFGTKE
ncbi:Ger(x)C family spore germination protein [Paenibacillus sp. NPDC101420]|uniref:Ger(x)C family spore germination protein n=1 Tax=Paenibacillus sp. NPDC101420 TaxID=3390602 RepID=UPI003D0184FE